MLIMEEDKLEIGEKVRVIGTSQIGRISEPYANDVGYRVVGHDEASWDYEYMRDELERLKPPRFRVGQHVVYTADGAIALTVTGRRYEDKLDCWFYQFYTDGPWLSETEDLISFPQPQFNAGDKVLLKDFGSSKTTYPATVVRPAVFRGNPAYEVELDVNKEHYNWAAKDVLPVETEEKLSIIDYLANSEGEKFFSLIEGEIEFKRLDGSDGWFVTKEGREIGIPLDDIRFPNSGAAHLYPSKESMSEYLLNPREAWVKYNTDKPTFSVVINIAEYQDQDVINDAHEALNRQFPNKGQSDKFIQDLTEFIKNYK